MKHSNKIPLVMIVVIWASAFVMLYQAFAYPFSIGGYLLITVLFVAAVLSLILYADEFLAALGVFVFSFVVRIMYYVTTHFLVFPWVDSYPQFALLRIFAENPHASVLTSNIVYSSIYPLSEIPASYSEWPGFSIISLSFSRLTGLTLFDTAIFIPLLLYALWFLVGYALTRAALSGVSSRVKNLPAMCMAAGTSLTAVEIIPPYFKYDLPAAVMLLAGAILLLRMQTRITRRSAIAFVIISAGIVVTHSLTALYWILLTALFVVIVSLRARRQNVMKMSGWIILPVFVTILASSWWIYYSIYFSYFVPPLSSLLSSLSLSPLSFSRAPSSLIPVLASLTPAWILKVLSFRDYVVLAMLFAGTILLLFKPQVMKNVKSHAVLLSAILIVGFTEFISVLSYQDRAFFIFAPFVGLTIALPLITLSSKRLRLAKLGSVLVIGLMLVAIAFGFWGSSYAPVYLYSSSVSSSAFGEHPTTWRAIGSYLTYASNPTCILTNEIYSTSLAISTDYYNITTLIGDKNPSSGCLAVVYYGLGSFDSSYLIEPGPFLPGFTYSSFQQRLNSSSDTVFETLNATVYYFS
jgi:hypothetical protein